VPMVLLNDPTSMSDNPSSKPSMVTKQSGPLAFTQSFGQNASQFINEWAVHPILQLQNRIPSFPSTSPKPCISNHLLIPFSPPPTLFPTMRLLYRNDLTTLKPYIRKSIQLISKPRNASNKFTNELLKTTTLHEVTWCYIHNTTSDSDSFQTGFRQRAQPLSTFHFHSISNILLHSLTVAYSQPSIIAPIPA
jgi:hypothetical protein